MELKLEYEALITCVFEQRGSISLPEHVHERYIEILIKGLEGLANPGTPDATLFEHTLRIPITEEMYDSFSYLEGAYCPMPPKKPENWHPSAKIDTTSKYQTRFPPIKGAVTLSSSGRKIR